MKNDLNKIYEEFGEQICLYPFLNGFYQTNHIDLRTEVPNSVRPCSVIMHDDINVWNIDSTIKDTRNNPQWKDTRKTFLAEGCTAVAGCQACAFNERNGATSARQMNNHFYAEHLKIDIIEEVKTIIANDCNVTKMVSMDYYPSNYCNYSCIMCAGGASSQRYSFEVKFLDSKQNMILNQSDSDFYELLKDIEIINLTGGETILQKQVVELIDYLIEQDLAKNIIITLITNASSYPVKLVEKFKQFKSVIYTISVDGVGDIIEYQRRGCKWDEVSVNAVNISRDFGHIVNCVVSAVSVFGIVDLLTWLEENKLNKVCISPVFRELHLSVEVIPDKIKQPLIERIKAAKAKVQNPTFIEYYNQVLSLMENTVYDPQGMKEFIKRIRIEDNASKKKLVEVVPEWGPYFV